MATETTPNLRYLPQLDGLRALAVLMVFAHHALTIPLLWAGVDLFFILSGYLITSILLRDRERMGFASMLKGFYVRRAERILPAYILFLLVAIPFERAMWSAYWPYYVFFLQNIPYAFHPGVISALVPLWSLAIEQHFYLLWPVLVFFLPRRWLPWTMGGLLLGEPVLRAVCTPLFPAAETIYAFTPFRLDAMAAGALAALLLPHVRAALAIRWAKVAMVVGLGLYGVLGFHHPWFSRGANTAVFNGLAYSLNILVLGGLFVWAAMSQGTWLTRVLSHSWLRWLGRISYSFYLFHLLILMQLQRLDLGRMATTLAAFALTVTIASLSWVLLEKRVLGWSASHRKG